jgi:hypothetical protein
MANALITRRAPWMAPVCPPGGCSRAPRRSWRHLVAGFAAGALSVATLAYAAATQWPPAAHRASVAAAGEEAWARELPREWRWTPPSVSVEHMYRSRR